jgi:hypothetical protein
MADIAYLFHTPPESQRRLRVYTEFATFVTIVYKRRAQK